MFTVGRLPGVRRPEHCVSLDSWEPEVSGDLDLLTVFLSLSVVPVPGSGSRILFVRGVLKVSETRGLNRIVPSFCMCQCKVTSP